MSSHSKLTRFELEIMKVFWKLGRAAVREVLEEFPEDQRPAYTTVQTIVRRLEDKGAVRRVRKIGNAFIFEPVVSRTSTVGRLLDELLSLVGGSAKPLVAHLVESGELSLADLKEVETLLKDRENEDDSENASEREGDSQ